MTRLSPRQRGYDSKWDRARRAFLAAHPFCAACEQRGKLHPATVVDHIEPHRGDHKLFWRRSNWQPLPRQGQAASRDARLCQPDRSGWVSSRS